MNDELILKNILKDISIQKRSDMKIEANNSHKSLISVTVSTAELFFKLIEKARPYITGPCMNWLTGFGKNKTPGHFPHSTQLEINELYDRGEVLLFLLKEFDQECALTTNVVEPLFIPCAAHTSVETVSLLKSIYRSVSGDKYLFARIIVKSKDVRLSTMNHFAIDILYQFVKEIIDLENK